MPKYLFQASYIGKGLEGLLKEGGSKRRETLEQTLKGMGGKLEAFYYAFGEDDVFAIVDLPDNVSTAAVALTVNRSGGVKVRTTVLLTPEEIDQVTKKSIDYRPPGQ
ncbi:MAG: GYD domain-containing protein [Candidatus Aenigmarchaeota archaeon]|nr:GYD domain-containing protein [Candidatus Aenigmarchaeota archaeon]